MISSLLTFGSEANAAISRDHLNSRLQSRCPCVRLFKPNHVNNQISEHLIATLDHYFGEVCQHPTLQVHDQDNDLRTSKDPLSSKPSDTAAATQMEVGKTVRGLYGVVYMGSDKFAARVTISTSEGKTVICTDPVLHSSPHDAALAYDMTSCRGVCIHTGVGRPR